MAAIFLTLKNFSPVSIRTVFKSEILTYIDFNPFAKVQNVSFVGPSLKPQKITHVVNEVSEQVEKQIQLKYLRTNECICNRYNNLAYELLTENSIAYHHNKHLDQTCNRL